MLVASRNEILRLSVLLAPKESIVEVGHRSVLSVVLVMLRLKKHQPHALLVVRAGCLAAHPPIALLVWLESIKDLQDRANAHNVTLGSTRQHQKLQVVRVASLASQVMKDLVVVTLLLEVII